MNAPLAAMGIRWRAGILLALWYWVHLWGLLYGLALAFPEKAANGDLQHPGPFETYRLLLWTLPDWFPASPLLFFGASLWGLLLIFALGAWARDRLGHRWRLAELSALSRQALTWSIRRSFRPPMLWWLLLLGLLLLAAAASNQHDELQVLLLGLVLSGCWLLSLLLLNPRFLQNGDTAKTGPLEWPGWVPAEVFCAGMLLLQFMSWLLPEFEGFPWVSLVALLQVEILGALLSMILIGLLIQRVRPAQIGLAIGARLNAPFLWLVAMLHWRLLLICLWLLPTLLLAALLLIYAVPQHESTMEQLGTDPGPWFTFLVGLARGLFHGGAYIFWLTTPVLLAFKGRALLLFDHGVSQSEVAYRPT